MSHGLIFEPDCDYVFTSEEEHNSWLIEVEALCGNCMQRIPYPGCTCGYPFPPTWGEWVAQQQDTYRYKPET